MSRLQTRHPARGTHDSNDTGILTLRAWFGKRRPAQSREPAGKQAARTTANGSNELGTAAEASATRKTKFSG